MERASEREGIRERSATLLSPRPSASRLSTVEMVDSSRAFCDGSDATFPAKIVPILRLSVTLAFSQLGNDSDIIDASVKIERT